MSKLLKSALVAIAIGSVAISPAWADRYGHHGGDWGYGHHGGHGGDWGGWGLGLLFGTAVYLAATAPPPVYYPPAPAYAAPVYVMPPVTVAPPPQMALQAPVASQNWWYYCAQAAGYYPYVKSCPSGWTRVSATPPE